MRNPKSVVDYRCCIKDNFRHRVPEADVDNAAENPIAQAKRTNYIYPGGKR